MNQSQSSRFLGRWPSGGFSQSASWTPTCWRACTPLAVSATRISWSRSCRPRGERLGHVAGMGKESLSNVLHIALWGCTELMEECFGEGFIYFLLYLTFPWNPRWDVCFPESQLSRHWPKARPALPQQDGGLMCFRAYDWCVKWFVGSLGSLLGIGSYRRKGASRQLLFGGEIPSFAGKFRFA